MIAIVIAIGLFLALSGIAACGKIDAAQADFEAAINELGRTGADFRAILNELIDKLNKDGQDLVSQVGVTLQGATAAATDQIKCDEDFVNQRVKQDLNNIRIVRWALKETPSPPTPWPCVSAPLDLRVSQIRDGTESALHVSGFDFSRLPLATSGLPDIPRPTVTLTVAPAGATPHTVSVQDSFVTVQPYDLGVNLTALDKAGMINDDTIKLTVTWPNLPPFEVQVAPLPAPPPPPPEVKNLSVVWNTTDDDKEDDITASATIATGPNWTQAGKVYFNDNTTYSFLLTPNHIALDSLKGQMVSFCGNRGGSWGWRFDAMIRGDVDGGRQLVARWPGLKLGDQQRCSVGTAFPQVLPIYLPPPPPSGGGPTGPGPCSLRPLREFTSSKQRGTPRVVTLRPNCP